MRTRNLYKKTREFYFIWGLAVFFMLLFVPHSSNAEILSSDSFRILDPVIDVGGGRSTSNSFIVLQSLSQLALGTSTASSFQLISGFLAFPTVTVPTVTATAGDGQVSLSWTAATGFLGWTVSGYNVGQSTTSGGLYTYTSVGNVTSRTVTGLTNGTTFFFVVRPEDAFGNSIATSTEVSATPEAAVEVPEEAPPVGVGGVVVGLLGRFILPPLRLLVPCPGADFNCDGKVNLQDFSIFLFAIVQPLPNPVDLNRDKVVNERDLSILFSAWTEPLLALGPEEVVPPRGFEGRPEEAFVPEGVREQFAAVGEVPLGEEPAVTPPEEYPRVGVIQRVGRFFLSTLERIIDFFGIF